MKRNIPFYMKKNQQKHVQRPLEQQKFILTDEYKTTIRNQSYLGKKGYTIPKSILDKTDEEEIRKELFVKPILFGPTQVDMTAFPVFRENANKYYLPRFYGIQRYGVPSKSEIQKGDDISIDFVKPLRDYQNDIIDVYMKHVRPEGDDSINGNGGILEVPCGRGKCLGKNTPILMYDGTIKMVQDICVGDILMGDDSTPRNVLTLARGREMMYKINGTNDCDYIVNESHILSLKYSKYINNNDVLDISVKDYLKILNNQYIFKT
jgi:hypothetical protein